MKPGAFDIHSHVNFAAFVDDRAEVLERTIKGGVWVINVGTQQHTSQAAVKIANQVETDEMLRRQIDMARRNLEV